MQNLVGRN